MNYEKKPLLSPFCFFANKYSITVIPDEHVKRVFSATDERLTNEENSRRRKESPFWFDTMNVPFDHSLLVFSGVGIFGILFFEVCLDVQKGNWLALVFFTIMVIFGLRRYFDIERKYTKVKSMSHLKKIRQLNYESLCREYDCDDLSMVFFDFLPDIEEQRCGEILVESFGNYTFLVAKDNLTECSYYLAEMREKLPDQNVIFYQGSQ